MWFDIVVIKHIYKFNQQPKCRNLSTDHSLLFQQGMNAKANVIKLTEINCRLMFEIVLVVFEIVLLSCLPLFWMFCKRECGVLWFSRVMGFVNPWYTLVEQTKINLTTNKKKKLLGEKHRWILRGWRSNQIDDQHLDSIPASTILELT